MHLITLGLLLVNNNPYSSHLKRCLPNCFPQRITSKLWQPKHLVFLVFDILKKFIETNFNKLFYKAIPITISEVFTNYF